MNVKCWGNPFIKLDLTNGTIIKETIEEKVQKNFLLGRGVGDWLLFNHVEPGKTDALSPDNAIIFGSGLLLGTNFPDDRLAPEDGANLFKFVTPILKRADITFGNLEGVLMDGGLAAKKCKNPTSCYVFRSPPHYAQYLKNAGFDVMSLANNHARDFGEEGRTASMASLDRVGLRHSGRVGDVARWQVKGVWVSLIAFAPFGGSHDLLDISLAQKQVASEVSKSDLVLVSIQAGAEGHDVMSKPFTNEMFYC